MAELLGEINRLKSKRRIISPMARGNGAYIVHRLLERNIKHYKVIDYNPYWTLLPFVLPFIASSNDANLIHTTPDYGIKFYKKSVPLILSFQNYVLDRWMQQYTTWFQWAHYSTDLRMWIKFALKKAHTLTAVSRFTASLARHDLKISKPIKIIYNGVDIAHFVPKRFSNSFSKEIRIFFSGNLTRRKGVHWLLPIAQRLEKNIKIYYTQGLRTRNRLASSPILKPIGYTSFENMPSRYRKMDILLMPTVREGFSLAVLEAMACGLPVIASNCSSLPEQIEHGKGGYLCRVGDVDDFAEKINFLSNRPGLRREMGEYNRRKVEEKFSLESTIKGYQELFEEIFG